MRPGAIRLVAAAVLLAFLSVPMLGAERGTAQQSSGTPDTINLYFYREDELGVAIREKSRLVQDTSIYFAALVELFRGPADDELGAGLTTSIPDGVSLEGPVNVDAGIATVDLSAEFRSGSAVLQAATPEVLARRMAQIVFTLTRFDEIQSVQFRIAGQPIDALDSDGATVFRPVTRDDYASITPIILVETPGVWLRTTSPLRLSGSANTFEANVQYRITDARGTTVTAGFFSATSGNGIRGTFDEEITFEVTRQGRATLVVFEQSAADGSEINVVAIPIEIVRSDSGTATATPSTTATASATPSVSATSTESATASATATGSPTYEATASVTATYDLTATVTYTATATYTPTQPPPTPTYTQTPPPPTPTYTVTPPPPTYTQTPPPPTYTPQPTGTNPP